jgi:serine/threonine-protein kinase HipA
MNSEAPQPEAYAWIWLPGAVEPVVAGRLAAAGPELHFNYGRSYLSRPDAISLYEPELPLRPGVLPLAKGLSMPGCIRDAAPDAWGRRVIVNKLTGARRVDIETERFDELTFLLESGSDRIGALDFQVSPDRYTPREAQAATLEELMDAARRVEEGVPMTPELERALLHGSSIGGARPKALIVDGDRKLIAKFSSQSDIFNVVKAEFVAMRLAACAGLKVAPVQLVKAAARDVLLVERFDRTPAEAGWARRAIVSALTLFSLDEMMARYASYEDLCEIIRCRFVDPKDTLREEFEDLCAAHAKGETYLGDAEQTVGDVGG